jgi:hypothetical protein
MEDYAASLESDIFTLVAGSKPGGVSKQRRRISVHAAILARLSPALAALVGNGMCETHSRTATLTETEPSTLKLFGVYAYTGQYKLRRDLFRAAWAKSAERADDPTARQAKWCTACGAAYTETQNRPKWGLGSCSRGYCFWYRTFPGCVTLRYCTFCRQEIGEGEKGALEGPACCEDAMMDSLQLGGFPKRKYAVNVSPLDVKCGLKAEEDWNEHRLIEHAKLYAFAQQWMVEPLMKLCLRNLHTDLLLLRLTAEGVDEVIELLEYTYTTTEGSKGGGSKNEGTGSELRNLVAGYVCWKEDELVRQVEVQAVLREHEEFFADFSTTISSQTECLISNGVHT